jgi:hypothetical protein
MQTAVRTAVDPQGVPQDSASAMPARRRQHRCQAFDAIEARAAAVPIDGERLITISSAGDAHSHRMLLPVKDSRLSLSTDRPGRRRCRRPRQNTCAGAALQSIGSLTVPCRSVRAYPGDRRPNLFRQMMFLLAALLRRSGGPVHRWCVRSIGGIVGFSAHVAQLLRQKRQQL